MSLSPNIEYTLTFLRKVYKGLDLGAKVEGGWSSADAESMQLSMRSNIFSFSVNFRSTLLLGRYTTPRWTTIAEVNASEITVDHHHKIDANLDVSASCYFDFNDKRDNGAEIAYRLKLQNGDVFRASLDSKWKARVMLER